MQRVLPSPPMLGSTSVTIDDWAALDEDDTRELVDGVLEEAEVPSVLHEVIVTWLHLLLGPYFRSRGGITLGAVKLAIQPRRGRIPDLACYGAASRLPRAGVVTVPPDVVIEVVSSSPEDERRDRIAKPQDYAELGARHSWIVDPWLRSLEIFGLDRAGRYVRLLAATGGVVDRVPGLPDLTVDVDAMWAEIDRLGE
jgi:Uma2 family endonuclease